MPKRVLTRSQVVRASDGKFRNHSHGGVEGIALKFLIDFEVPKGNRISVQGAPSPQIPFVHNIAEFFFTLLAANSAKASCAVAAAAGSDAREWSEVFWAAAIDKGGCTAVAIRWLPQ